MSKVFRISGRDGKRLSHWYGKIKVANRKWQRVKLFTDKVASQRRLVDLQKEADLRSAGVRTVVMDYAGWSIERHSADYIAALRLEKRDSDTLRLAQWTLNKLIEWGKWTRIADVTADSVRRILSTLDRQAKTASYQNKFIMRAKAFVHWMEREGRIVSDPLANLKRVDERNGTRRRARRALTDNEVNGLLAEAPPDRREKYAWALLAGMRRSELAKLRWGDLRLSAPRPFIQLRAEQTKNGKADVLPLHPYLLKLIQARDAGDADARVVSSVPDMKTMVKDLTRAGISLADSHGKRADFHALRHTFCTNLDRTGCSYTTKRALMRHSDSGVTEGYSHARLDELYTAIERLPAPLNADRPAEAEAEAVKTGTDAAALPNMELAGLVLSDHRLDQSWTPNGHSLALSDGSRRIGVTACGRLPRHYNRGIGTDLHSLASISYLVDNKSLNSKDLRPDTQVD